MKKLFFRYIWFILGILINSFGIAFITKASLGTSPISSVPYVLSFRFPLSFGGFTFLLNMLFILGEVVLLRRQFRPYQYLQIVVNMIFSSFIDVSMTLLGSFTPVHFASQILSLLAGCAILALGICVEVAPNVLVVPGEGIVKAIAQVSRKKIRQCKSNLRCHIDFDRRLPFPAVLPPFKRLRNRNHHFRSFGRQNRKLYPEALTYFKTYPNSRINKTKKEGMLGASS